MFLKDPIGLFLTSLRSEAIASLKVVDYVAINYSASAALSLKYLKPDFYCKGKDYKNFKDDITGQIKNEVKILKRNKGKFVLTDEITFSSSSLLNLTGNINKSKHNKTIKEIKKRTNFFQIKNIIDKIKKDKILVIGETIIDQYNFCEAMGKSGKEPVLVLKVGRQILGGAAFIAKNVASFSECFFT